MRHNMVLIRALVMGALIGAVVPATALAQSAPTTPTDPNTIIQLLPGPMGSVLAADIRQIQGSQNQADVANATQIFQQALAADLSTAETNLENDASMGQGSATPAVQADQQLVSQLLALNSAVMAMQPPMQPEASPQ